MAEWLRRWTSDPMDTLRAGSNPGTGGFICFNDDDGGAMHSGTGERQHARISAANVGTSFDIFVKVPHYNYCYFLM